MSKRLISLLPTTTTVWIIHILKRCARNLADGVGIEPTHRFPDDSLASCCLNLSANHPNKINRLTLAQRDGIEPPSLDLESKALPLDERRILAEGGGVEPHPR